MPKTIHPYPDHLFGDGDKPPKSFRTHLKRTLGLHHHANFVRDHNEPEAPLAFYATTSQDQPFQSVTLASTKNDWKTSTETPFEALGLLWDTPAWTWKQYWRTDLDPPSMGGMLRYKIFGILADGKRVYADNRARMFTKADSFAIFMDPNPGPPAWSKQARVYHVFVDRFNPGESRDWLQTQDLLKPFGGTLQGVIEKLEYIKDLGFNALWLSPIFKSPSHHGYDTSDYEQIEPRFGTEADLQELIEKAHKLGLRVILDFVANHCSKQHPALQAALSDPISPYRAWFKWQRWPHYKSYYNVASMPELNLSFSSPARAHLLTVAQKWLRLGVDGYRLDYANGPSQEFWADFRRACREINPECWTFGEIVSSAEEQTSFHDTMDGTLDFLTCQALRETIATRHWPLSRLCGYLDAYAQSFFVNFSRPAFIDNHDMNRFFFTALENRSALQAALSLLYLMPGQPVLYYGTETELSQRQSIHDRGASGFDEARLAMNWQNTGDDTSALIRELSALREANPWLSDAEWHTLHVDDRAQQAEIELTHGNHSLHVSVSLNGENLKVSWK